MPKKLYYLDEVDKFLEKYLSKSDTRPKQKT